MGGICTKPTPVSEPVDPAKKPASQAAAAPPPQPMNPNKPSAPQNAPQNAPQPQGAPQAQSSPADPNAPPMDDPNLAKVNRRVRRGSVSSEATNAKGAQNELKEKKVIPKSEEAMKSIERAIEKNILFKGLDEEQKKDILNAMFEKKVVKDDVIIKQGDEGDNFYVIDSGEFDIYVKIDGNPKKVLTVSSGGSFGELALMYNAPRAATVIATTEGLLWCVDRQTFRAILMDTTSKKRKLYETFLESVPILQTLTKWERYTIADALEPTSFDDGEYIIKQGDSGDLFYIIEKGDARATKSPSADIAPVEVKKMSVGDYFGEIALLTNEPRAANVIAIGRFHHYQFLVKKKKKT
eukprot:TRINITY_DN1867_c0_g1_i15.p2 TRINITY_DN1867_c0_g1~~TRINITY_DN1867_c0_g1_i15.p2  ORF type:complete len:352 (+),score=90.66 TRINITY_DN1867_c0_g1_i15:252-1307(+)